MLEKTRQKIILLILCAMLLNTKEDIYAQSILDSLEQEDTLSGWDKAKNWASDKLDTAKNYVDEHKDEAKDWVIDKKDEVKEFANDHKDEVKAWVDEKSTDLKDAYGKVKEKAGEVKDGVIRYNHEDLAIVTSSPSVDPALERNYYIIDKTAYAKDKTHYYDAEGNEVDQNYGAIAYQIYEKKYVDLVDDEHVFRQLTLLDNYTGEISTNTVSLSSDELYIPDCSYTYGYFADLSDIVPGSLISDIYSLADLKHISSYINNVDYELQSSNSLVRKP